MGKLLSATLIALAVGLCATEHSAEAASYAGGASTRCCPVPQECGGHIEYQLQRQVVLQPVTETVYETQQINCVRNVCETVMQPRTITCMETVTEQCVRSVPYTVQKPCYRTVYRQCAYTVQRPVSRTVWKECTYTVCRPVRETHMESRSYTVCTPVRPEDDPDGLGLQRGTLAGGWYLRGRLVGEPPQVYEGIAGGMQELLATMERDNSRPLVEFYRRHDQIELWLPIGA